MVVMMEPFNIPNKQVYSKCQNIANKKCNYTLEKIPSKKLQSQLAKL
jgi:hypothetical protein